MIYWILPETTLREGREASKKTALFEGGRRSVRFSCGSITSLEGENHIQSCLFCIVSFAIALIMNLIFLLIITVTWREVARLMSVSVITRQALKSLRRSFCRSTLTFPLVAPSSNMWCAWSPPTFSVLHGYMLWCQASMSHNLSWLSFRSVSWSWSSPSCLLRLPLEGSCTATLYHCSTRKWSL